MARLARAEIFDPAEIVAVHPIGKTVRSCYLTGVDESLSVPARISITENVSLGTTWYRADALVSHGEGFWKSVYERSRNGKECFGGSQS